MPKHAIAIAYKMRPGLIREFIGYLRGSGFLGWLQLFRLCDRFAERLDGGDSGRTQAVLGYIAPNCRRIQWISHAAAVYLKGILRRANLVANMWTILRRCTRIGSRRSSTPLAPDPNAAIRRLGDAGAIVDGTALDGGLHDFARASPDRDHQVRFCPVQHWTESAPFHQSFLHIFAGGGVGHGLGDRLSRVWLYYHKHGRGFQNVVR